MASLYWPRSHSMRLWSTFTTPPTMSPWFLWYDCMLIGDNRWKHLLENLRCFGQCFTSFIFLSCFCFICKLLFFSELIIEFVLDCMISREVNLFWGATLLVLLLCH